MSKHVVMVFAADGEEVELGRRLVENGWLETNVKNAFIKAYRDIYDDNDIIGSAKVELEDLCALSAVTPRACVIHVGTTAPGLFGE